MAGCEKILQPGRQGFLNARRVKSWCHKGIGENVKCVLTSTMQEKFSALLYMTSSVKLSAGL
jgi:hypothetical protein